MKISQNDKKVIKKSRRYINSEIETRIKEYRNLWKGLKAGSMGSAKSCKQKLTRWMQENPEYTFDDILNAAELYILSINDLRYLQNAEFFIFKQNPHREESSRLSAFIDEVNDKETLTGDWTSSIN